MLLFSDLTTDQQNMRIRFVQRTVKDVYEVVLETQNGVSVSDILCSRFCFSKVTHEDVGSLQCIKEKYSFFDIDFINFHTKKLF